MNAIRTSELAKRVSAALLEDERTEDETIEVIEENGMVTLKGEVSSAEVQKAAETIAEQQEGVITVVNALEVEVEPEGLRQVVAHPTKPAGPGADPASSAVLIPKRSKKT